MTNKLNLSPLKKNFSGFHLFLAALLSAAFLSSAGGAFAQQEQRDQGFTSDVHRQYSGKIVFANEPINLQKPDASKFKTAFNASETIYGRVFVPKSIRNTKVGGDYPSSLVNLNYFVTIDGQPEVSTSSLEKIKNELAPGGFYGYTVSGKEMYEWTSWQAFILPASNYEYIESEKVYIPAGEFARAFAALAPGEHRVRLEMRFRTLEKTLSPPIAAGEFTINIKPEDKKILAGKYRKGLPDDAWKGKPDHAQLLAQISGALEKEMKDKPIRVGVVSSAWIEGRYTDTLVNYRRLVVWAAWGDKDGDGYGHITSYTVVSTKNSDGSWSSLRFEGFSHNDGGPDYPISANLLK